MCGISGAVDWRRPPDADGVARMTSCLSHRGPDGHGLATDGAMAFGHRRLAIIDLSPGGAQPMTDSSGRWTITFNGEIYNYGELREELTRHGVTFRSRSDTEVILEAFRRWGVDSFGRFNGMFAFALWDHQRRELWLVRDRFGKKP